MHRWHWSLAVPRVDICPSPTLILIYPLPSPEVVAVNGARCISCAKDWPSGVNLMQQKQHELPAAPSVIRLVDVQVLGAFGAVFRILLLSIS
jgi:hypothetical protein